MSRIRIHDQLALLQSLLGDKAIDGRYHEIILHHVHWSKLL
jgi:hypothetical protein